MEKWSSASIHDWWNDNPWPCGFNYLPSTAVNFLEFWHPNSFDRDRRSLDARILGSSRQSMVSN